MKNHVEMTLPRIPSRILEQGDRLAFEGERGLGERNRFHRQTNELTEDIQKTAFPVGQWVNRGENDGLDYFL